MTQWDFVGGSEEGAIAICAQFLKHITSHYEGFQKCMSHAFYASTIPLSDYFVTVRRNPIGLCSHFVGGSEEGAIAFCAPVWTHISFLTEESSYFIS